MKRKSTKVPRPSKKLRIGAERLAKLIALNCVRNTFLENLHSGTTPDSKTGDFSDVKVVSPFGEIPWNNLSRISDEEMKKLNKEIVNKIFTFLLHLENEIPPVGQQYFRFPSNWDAAEIDSAIQRTWERARESENNPNG